MPLFALDHYYSPLPFGLLMITGDVIAIEKINTLIQDDSGIIWLDATMLAESPVADRLSSFTMQEVNGHPLFTSPTSRNNVSINAAYVVAAFELANIIEAEGIVTFK